MNILFVDKIFPGVFEHLATELAKNPDNCVWFITSYTKNKINGINIVIYNLPKNVSRICHPLTKTLEDAAFHGEFAANAAINLQKKGIIPDIIIGSATGASIFMKDAFPNSPYLCYFDTFYNPENQELNEDLNDEQKIALKCKNAGILVDLYTCDAGVTPTIEQKNRFPVEFQHKIKVLQNEEYLDYVYSLIAKKELA